MVQPDTGAREHRERRQGLLAAGPEGAVTDDQAGQTAEGVARAAAADQQPAHQQPAHQQPAHQQPAHQQPAHQQPAHQQPALPPGQYIPRTLPVLHYGPVPAFNSQTWDLRIMGATESGDVVKLRWDDVAEMPAGQVTADFHCVTKFTVLGVQWAGLPATELLRRFPPAAAVTHVMIWADFGYSANIRISDFAAEGTLLATHRDGERLSPEHGYPLRLVVPHLYAWKSVKWVRALEYLTADRRGFWEERGYHNIADPWQEQRYSYQEREGEGPPL